MADFEEQKLVLFQGQWYFSEAVRWDYLPVLLTIQLTEPVIPLAVVGMLAAIRGWRRNREQRVVTLVALVWLVVVAVTGMLPGAVHYDNFRHLLFILPALFVFFAIGMDQLIKRVRPRGLMAVLLGCLLLPGILGIVGLHPYEYIFYNSLAGGIRGADGEFPLDYWCTSYREAMEYINQTAEAGDTVMVMAPVPPARAFAQSYLDVLGNAGDLSVSSADFLLTCGRWVGHDWGDPHLERTYTVGKGGVTLAEVFRRREATP